MVVLQVEQSHDWVNTTKISTMKFYLTLFLSLVAFAFGEDVKEEEDVLVLTEAVFDQVTTDNEHILVEFCKFSET